MCSVWRIVATFSLIMLTAPTVLWPSLTAAQEVAPPGVLSTPPPLGAALLLDSLLAPGFVMPNTSATGACGSVFDPDGYRLRASGKCVDSQQRPFVAWHAKRLVVPDGEVRLEFRTAAGHDRAEFVLWLRDQNTPDFSTYLLRLQPAAGVAALGLRSGGKETTLARRNDLAAIFAPESWLSIAVRLQGPNLWVLLNDEVILPAADATYDRGTLNVVVSRQGDPSDDQEVAVVLRNLAVSSLSPPELAREPMLGCQLKTPLPGNIVVSPSPSELDPKLAGYSGSWEGLWTTPGSPDLPSRLVVEHIDAAAAGLIYSYGEASSSFQGSSRVSASVQPDGSLTFGTGARFTFLLSEDLRRIVGQRDAVLQDGTPIHSEITLARCGL